MGKRLTHEEFVSRVQSACGDDYEILGQYKNRRTKVKCRHIKCGREWDVNPSSLMRGHGCICGMQKSHEQFVQELENIAPGRYTLLTPYKGIFEKVKVKHNDCSYVWETTADALRKCKNCPRCFRNNNRENGKRSLLAILQNEYIIVDDYVDNRTKIKFKHLKCGTEFMVVPSTFYRAKSGSVCPNCWINPKKLTNDEFLERAKAVSSEYEFLDDYVDMVTKIRYKHLLCGSINSITPADFLDGHGCPTCNDRRAREKKREKQGNHFRQRLAQKFRGTIMYKGKYKNNTTTLTFHDLKCGTTYSSSPATVLHSDVGGCPTCRYKSQPKTNEQFVSEVEELVGDEYTFLEQYVGAHCKIKCRHNRCGHVWSTQPCNFLTGYGCPKCSQSQGERTISKWLQDRDIHFIPQKKFNDCFDKSYLPFDFYVPQYNLAIEYDGEQHYKPEKFFGGEEAYKIRHKHDLIKNKYCEDNDINLLRIPYTVTGEDIGKVIQNKLDELKQLDNVA